ncbi:MAG: LacI family DNA-binding transcriptional regulator [Treponema sp.]|nr:LacI family DNA-binding transcriptional regulator [Treponema sp.]MEE3314534.1 LacI family DNA-binding transcriptional regulator [Treponema sp.]
MATIYDIAKATGYSAPTISKALNGTGLLSEKTRNRIIQVAKEMGYAPNLSARTLSTKKSSLIGVVYDDPMMNRYFDHPLFSIILNRFREQVEKSDYDIIFLSGKNAMSYTAHALYRSVDAVAIINPDLDHYADFREMAERSLPCISTNDTIPGICAILSRNYEIGYQATKYFIDRGHRRIAYLSGPNYEFSRAAEERQSGYENCLAENGIPVDSSLIEVCPLWRADSAYEGFSRLIERAPDITAVFVASDSLAVGIYRYAEEKGISLPGQISLIGVDDDKISTYLHPRLTTFRQDGISIADMAAEMLMNQIAGLPVPPEVRFSAKLVERDSVLDLKKSSI